MVNKAEVLMHPVRMKISQALLRHKHEGLTSLEMVQIIKDVPQATLYRHIQVLSDANVIRVAKEKKVRAVSEKYYVINESELILDQNEWDSYSQNDKLSYITYYQLILITQYEDYLNKLDDKTSDKATFSLAELQLDDEQFNQFQQDLQALMIKYYNQQDKTSNYPYRTVGLTVIPDI